MSQNAVRWIVGTHACQEALKVEPRKVTGVYFQNLDEAKHPEWASLLNKVKVKPQNKSAGFFKDLSEFGHQGIAVSTEYWPAIPEKGEGDKSICVFLDGLEDPHNLGAIVRTSWLMDVDAIFITDKQSVKVTPAVCKVASGGVEHVPVVTTHFLSEMKELKEKGHWIYGFSDKAEKSLYDVKFSPKTTFVFGSEEKGVRIPVMNECDELLSIPQVAQGASYNVSVAVGIALGELRRQLK